MASGASALTQMYIGIPSPTPTRQGDDTVIITFEEIIHVVYSSWKFLAKSAEFMILLAPRLNCVIQIRTALCDVMEAVLS